MPPRLIAAGRRLRSADVLIVLGLFLFALVIRIVGIRGWLPYVGHPDEPKVIDSAIHIVKSGDLNPNLYIWPSLYIYLEAIVVRLHTWWGTLRGYYDGAGSLPDITHIFSLAPGVYMWARTLTAVIGAATISVLYVVGKQMFDRMTAERYPHLTFVNRGTSLTPEDQEQRYGPELWQRDPDRCCQLRKVEPLRRALRGADVWVTSLMRRQSGTRASIGTCAHSS